jgi:hypothetical protein
MSGEKWKRPNAFKHGIFSAIAILPGEDRREFEQLLADVNAEWWPAGATEEEAVLSLASGIWLKRRQEKFFEIRHVKNFSDPRHPSYNHSLGLRGLVACMEREPETAFEELASRMLPPDKITYLKRKCPRGDFDSTAEWAAAVINEIKTVLIPAYEIAEPQAAALGELVKSAAAVPSDLFRQELALDERLDAKIDRAVKRLVQIKAMKQMLGQTGALRTDNQPNEIGRRPITRRADNQPKKLDRRPITRKRFRDS